MQNSRSRNHRHPWRTVNILSYNLSLRRQPLNFAQNFCFLTQPTDCQKLCNNAGFQRTASPLAARGKEKGLKGKGKTTALNGGLSFPLSKVIINAEAFNNTKDNDLKEFLEYLKTGKAKSEFTKEIEEMVQTIKNNEQARQEYRLMSTFEMDAIEKGIYRKAIDTAKLMKLKNFNIALIKEITGLPESEIEKL